MFVHTLESLEEFEDYIKQLDEKVGLTTNTYKEVMNAIIKERDKLKKMSLSDVVATLPNEKSKEFKRWTQSKGYASCYNGLWYSKNGVNYDTKVLHRAFTNEIEFGNQL